MCKSCGAIGRASGNRAELSLRREFDPRQIHFFLLFFSSFFKYIQKIFQCRMSQSMSRQCLDICCVLCCMLFVVFLERLIVSPLAAQKMLQMQQQTIWESAIITVWM